MVSGKKVGVYRPKLLMSAHGIRTAGRWQKELAPVFGACVNRIESFDYGTYKLWRFLQPRKNEEMIDRFYEWYGNKVTSTPGVDLSNREKRPSCIAHSLGTWIVGMAMRKHDDIVFDKLLFSGSILPEDFEWDCLIADDRVGSVYNECGGRDIWPTVASKLVRGTGASGSKGFATQSPMVTNRRHKEFRHSDFQVRRHMETRWRPFLLSRPSPLCVRHGRDIETRAQFEKILGELRAIDGEIYGVQPDYAAQALAPGRSLTWIKINPDIYTILIDRSSECAVGYVNAMPVTDEAYAEIRSGKLQDKDIGDFHVAPYRESGPVKLYLMSVAVADEARNWGLGLGDQGYSRLLGAVKEKLIGYAEDRGIAVSHLLAVVWTAAGRTICRQLGMEKVGVDPKGHDIFELEVTPLIEQGAELPSSQLKRVVEAYRAMPRARH
ncbi:MAG: hypothetical protein QOG72_437 [Sphingomonadales bacterium]|jgi:GNAT superfamily N-acetyltransferase|nr:hypothetical protein [Sphingomonadales bacterium]